MDQYTTTNTKPATKQATTMAEVAATVAFKGRREPKGRIMKESTLKSRSLFLRNQLNNTATPADGSPKTVDVVGSFGPMTMLLDQLNERGTSKNFKVHFAHLAIEQVCMLYEATELLEIVPKQIDLRLHIRGWISHEKMSPGQIITLHQIFERSKDEKLPSEKLSIWGILIHQTAYWINEKMYTAEEADEMQKIISAQHPELAEVISSKIDNLQTRRNNYEEAKAKEQQRKETKAINKRVAEHKAEQREQKKAELRGERELSEGTARHVLTRGPEVIQATIQEGKHGRRNRPGEGKRWTKMGGGEDKKEGEK